MSSLRSDLLSIEYMSFMIVSLSLKSSLLLMECDADFYDSFYRFIYSFTDFEGYLCLAESSGRCLDWSCSYFWNEGFKWIDPINDLILS